MTATQCARKLERQRIARCRTGNACEKRYARTPKGFLVRVYRNMLSRVTGIQQTKAHLYLGLPILPREQFYAWALGNESFWRLWANWTVAKHERTLTPSVNRVDARRGYVLDNMEWVTMSVNCADTRRRKVPLVRERTAAVHAA